MTYSLHLGDEDTCGPGLYEHKQSRAPGTSGAIDGNCHNIGVADAISIQLIDVQSTGVLAY